MADIIRPRQYGSPQNAPQQQDWYTGTWPSNPGDPCNPGCAPAPPSCFSAVAKADACWDQSQALYNLVYKVVADVLQQNPGLVPPPPPSAGSGPIRGVTDGSNANPGDVGEYIELSQNVNVPATPTQIPVSIGVLQPGDWDCFLWVIYNAPVTSGEFWLNPQPPGFSNAMYTFSFTGTAFDPAWMTVQSSLGRANLTAPTLVAITLMSNYAGNAAAATTAQVIFQARRVR